MRPYRAASLPNLLNVLKEGFRSPRSGQVVSPRIGDGLLRCGGEVDGRCGRRRRLRCGGGTASATAAAGDGRMRDAKNGLAVLQRPDDGVGSAVLSGDG